jgi:anti-anti-sigma regulatory factor
LACPLPYQLAKKTQEKQMLRLTQKPIGTRGAAIHAQGRLVGEWVALLEAECDRALRDRDALELDLAGVTDVDAEGLMALRRLRKRAANLVGCTPILLAMLEERPV